MERNAQTTKKQRQGWLDRMRSKPMRTRRMYALSLSALITLVIFFVWVVSFSGGANSSGQTAADNTNASPFQVFENDLANIFSTFRQQASVIMASSSAVTNTDSAANSTTNSDANSSANNTTDPSASDMENILQ